MLAGKHKAAERLRTSQPAISRTIAELEHALSPLAELFIDRLRAVTKPLAKAK